MKNVVTAVLYTLGALWISAAPAVAQVAYPTKPVKILVPYAPGGATDVVARIVADQFRTSLGQSFVIENKTGASGILAIEEMARAKPDGYTLMVGNVSTNAITPALFPKKLSIDYERSVVPVARLADLPTLLVVPAKRFPPTTLAAFLTYAKANPGKVNYGSAGIGAFNHFDFVMLAKAAGVEMSHVPIKAGASGMLQSLLAGDIQAALLTVPTIAPMIKAGELRALAVAGTQRLADYPDVPTFAEAGFTGIGTVQWQAMFAPEGTPDHVLDTLHKALAEAIRSPAVQTAFAKSAILATPAMSTAEARQWLRSEIDAWRRIVRETKIDLEE
jgi:tripartite-type tricarboxylate transporter receptor subunit TctC